MAAHKLVTKFCTATSNRKILAGPDAALQKDRGWVGLPVGAEACCDE
jgi:hypothetical protein